MPGPRPELVHVHIPKTAGTAFRALLETVYGRDEVLHDDDDRPHRKSLFNTDFERWKRENQASISARSTWPRAITGHVWLGKYEPFFPEAFTVTWLREPAARLASLYHRYRSTPGGRPGSMHRKVVEEGLSLVETAELPHHRDQVARLFLRGYEPSDLDFVGILEHFDEDLRDLARLLGWPPVSMPVTNETRSEEYGRFRFSPEELERIRWLNREDVELYETALALRARRKVPA